ncbi:MAG: sugar ABC transporter ATP-binding protein [Hyphomicrobiales bacterium]
MTLELSGIGKSFPGVKALDGVSTIFHPGEVHALLGENGAGKSTLIKAICGIHRADEGTIRLDGEALNLSSLGDGMAKGITIVNQEIQVFSEASIAENIMIDKLQLYRSGMGLDWQRLNRDAAAALKRVGLDLDPEAAIGDLSAAQKQLVQIAKALSRETKVLLLDEPTSSITANEVARLFALVRELRNNGITLIFVSHKLEEVLEICDRVTVLRDGHHVGTKPIAELDRDDIVEMMIGRKLRIEAFPRLETDQDTSALEVNGVSAPGLVDNASFTLRQGEVLGFYGLVGSGRTELARTLIGLYSKSAGTVSVNGEPVEIADIGEAIEKYRIGYVSENRKEDGLFLDFDIEMNMTMAMGKRLQNPITRAIDGKRQRRIAEELMSALDVRATGIEQRVGDLSGGNQQKISIAKWLAADCDILIVDEPSVGVDVGAKSMIHKLIWDLASTKGKSVIVISSDMPEIISLASRILVFKERRIVGEVPGLPEPGQSEDSVSQAIGRLMA